MTDDGGIFAYQRKEEWTGVPNPEEEGRWLFKPVNVSSYFTFAMTEEWPERIYADYYIDFWEPLLRELKSWDKPVTIYVDVAYQIGSETEETIRQYMQEWLELQPGYLAVAQPEKENDLPKFVHLHIKGVEIQALKAEGT